MNAVAPSRSRRWARAFLAGPIALIAALVVMTGGALWVPAGTAEVNNLVLPVILFPLLWTIFFLYACLDKRIPRAYWILGTLTSANAALIVWHLLR
ncbi:MAG: hypothetical protein WDO56_05895 [Gammaproteobacteria bacterium]